MFFCAVVGSKIARYETRKRGTRFQRATDSIRSAEEVPVLMFVMVEKGLGSSRCASCATKTC